MGKHRAKQELETVPPQELGTVPPKAGKKITSGTVLTLRWYCFLTLDLLVAAVKNVFLVVLFLSLKKAK